MPEQLPLTALLNRIFGGPVTALLNALSIHPKYPQAPIPNYLSMEILVVAILFLLFILVRASLSVDRPRSLQHIFEGVHGFIENQSKEIIGPHSEMFTAFLALQFLFILLCNLLGLIPGFESPTAEASVPLGCALVAFVYYNYQGVRQHGPLGYAKLFAGPMWWLAPLMVPIEIISNLARVMSLTIRLFANMFAGEMVTMAFFSLVPLALPLLFIGLHAMVAFIQAYIFVLLPMVYLAEATAQEH